MGFTLTAALLPAPVDVDTNIGDEGWNAIGSALQPKHDSTGLLFHSPLDVTGVNGFPSDWELLPLPVVEVFSDSNVFDLSGISLVFNGTKTCIEPSPGKLLDDLASATRLRLGNEHSSNATLETFVFPIAGRNYSLVCVSSSGFVMLGSCPTMTNETLLDLHFELPGVAAFSRDLNPRAGGEVMVQEVEGEKLTVQFKDVPVSGRSGAVSFQIDLRADGAVRVAYMPGSPVGYVAIVGMSYGPSTLGPEGYKGVDLSRSPPCHMP